MHVLLKVQKLLSVITIQYCIILYPDVLLYYILYHTTVCYTTLHLHYILYHVLLYCALLYNTILSTLRKTRDTSIH